MEKDEKKLKIEIEDLMNKIINTDKKEQVKEKKEEKVKEERQEDEKKGEEKEQREKEQEPTQEEKQEKTEKELRDEEAKKAEEELLKEEPEFEKIFDNIKIEKHERKKKAKERRERLIKKMEESRSKEINEKLKKASKIDNMSIEDISQGDIDEVLSKDEEEYKLPRKKSYLENVIDEDYESILKISSRKIFNKKEYYPVMKKCDLEEVLVSECEQVFKKQADKKKKQKIKRQIRMAKIENFFFEENREDENIQRGINGDVKEYKGEGDEVPISTKLLTTRLKLRLQSILMFVLLFLSFIMVFIKRFMIGNTDGYMMTVYVASQLFTLLFGMIIGRETIKNGLRTIIRLRCNMDTALTVASFVSIVHAVITLFNIEEFSVNNYSTYCILPLFALFMNTIGKLYITKRTLLNFKHLKVLKNKYAVKLCSAREVSSKLSRELKTGKNPCIVYKEKFNFIKGFIAKSAQPDECEVFSGRLTYIGIILSILIFIIKQLFSNNLYSSFTLLSATLALFIPICSIASLNFRFYFLCKLQVRKGNIMINKSGLNDLAQAKYIALNDSDLYYGKAVSLYGMKMFNNYPAESLTIDTAAVLKEVSSPLYATFKKMIKGREDVLPYVDSFRYYENKGIEARVRGRRMLIGNRVLLSCNNILPPQKEIEDKYEKKGKFVTYIAIDGMLCAMLVVSYKPSPRALEMVKELEENNIKLIVRSYDPNINARLISEQFKILYSSVKVQGEADEEFFRKARKKGEQSENEAFLVTSGRTLDLADIILSSSKRVRSNKVVAVLQVITVLFLFSFVAVLGLSAGTDSIKTFDFFTVEVISTCLMMIIPWIDRK